MNEKPNLLLLFSGGYDSTLLLKLALSLAYNPFCLIINYQQKHIQELDFAKKLCKEHYVSFEELFIKIPAPSSLSIIEQKTYEGVSPWHVPARNLIFVSFAASIAEAKEIPLIWFGANYEDREQLFPDCYQEWVYAMNTVLKINGSSKVTLEAPLLGMTKDTIKKLATTFKIDETQIFSGYGK